MENQNLIESARNVLQPSNQIEESIMGDIKEVGKFTSQLENQAKVVVKELKNAKNNPDAALKKIGEAMVKSVNLAKQSKLDKELKVTFIAGFVMSLLQGLKDLGLELSDLEKMNLPNDIQKVFVSRNPPKAVEDLF